MTRGALITFSGVDLAGKSTQLALTDQWLRSLGLVVQRRWHRPGYSPMLDKARAVVRALRPGALPPAGESSARTRAFQRPGVRETWIAMACVDTVVQHGVRTRLERALGRVVLCDRYVHDGIVDLALRFPELSPRRLGAVLAAMCPTPDLPLLLMLSWEEVQRRVATKAEPFPDPDEVRFARYEAYQRLASSGLFEVVPAEAPVDVVHARIRERITALLRRRLAVDASSRTSTGGLS